MLKTNQYEDPSILYQLKNEDYFVRYLFLAWIAFSIYMFKVNPEFFSITCVVAGLFVIGIPDRKINLKSDCIEIRNKRWLPILSGEDTLLISDIKSAEHYINDPGGLISVISMVDTIPGRIRRTDKIFIEFKDSRDIYEIRIGSLKEKKIFTEKLQERIQSLSKH